MSVARLQVALGELRAAAARLAAVPAAAARVEEAIAIVEEAIAGEAATGPRGLALTPRQRAILERLSRSRETWSPEALGDGLRGLVRRGFVEAHPHLGRYRVTAAGRAALADEGRR